MLRVTTGHLAGADSGSECGGEFILHDAYGLEVKSRAER
jgi:hypothetical protein